MCRSMVDIQSATAKIMRGIKKIEDRRKKPQGKNIMSASAMQGGHNKRLRRYTVIIFAMLACFHTIWNVTDGLADTDGTRNRRRVVVKPAVYLHIPDIEIWNYHTISIHTRSPITRRCGTQDCVYCIHFSAKLHLDQCIRIVSLLLGQKPQIWPNLEYLGAFYHTYLGTFL